MAGNVLKTAAAVFTTRTNPEKDQCHVYRVLGHPEVRLKLSVRPSLYKKSRTIHAQWSQEPNLRRINYDGSRIKLNSIKAEK